MFSLQAAKSYAPRMSLAASDADDDAALARRIVDCRPKRDATAEAELCRRLGPRIRLYGLKHLRNEAAAADLMQDVLLMVLQKLREGAVREPERVASFVLGAARQTVIDWRRSGRRRVRILAAFPVDLVPQDEEAPDPIDTQRLGRCLAALPERERAVLVMTFYDDRPADAVAQQLGLSAGNVRVIRHRGLERLRGCMKAAGETT
jgi:RNA polymerase sigma-70 factor (ECF subfamily)